MKYSHISLSLQSHRQGVQKYIKLDFDKEIHRSKYDKFSRLTPWSTGLSHRGGRTLKLEIYVSNARYGWVV